jgi:hypothetical protein
LASASTGKVAQADTHDLTTASTPTFASILLGGADRILTSDAAGILAQRNSTNAQALRVYGLYTDASNYERATIKTANTDATTGPYVQFGAETAGSGADDIDLILTPTGTGALIAGPKPDGTAAGGNARGAYAVDLQTIRGSQSFVASGLYAVLVGAYSAATASQSVCIGTSLSASAESAACVGGDTNLASAKRSSVFGGNGAYADRYGMDARSAGAFATYGDSQRADFDLRCKTTTNAAVEMALDGGTTYLTIPSGKVMSGTINVHGVKSDGSAVAHYMRQFCIKNVGGTTSLVALQTVGTDTAASTSLAVTADDTGDYLSIQPTGITSEVWRWTAHVEAVETVYGT